MLRKVLFAVFGIACFLAAAFVLLMAYVSFTSPEIGAAFGAFLFAIAAVVSLVGFFVFKKAVSGKQNDAIGCEDYANYGKSFAAGLHKGLQETDDYPNVTASVIIPEHIEEAPAVILEPEKEESVTSPEPVKEEHSAAVPGVSVLSGFKKTAFFVAGIYYREDAVIDNLLYENSDYEMRKSEIVECGMEDTYIYKYDTFYGYADLVPEPDNPHDPNAIKVIVDNVHIGYVPAKSTKSIKKIIESNNVIEISCEIYGGPYKVLPDVDADIERGKTDFKSKISIEYK